MSQKETFSTRVGSTNTEVDRKHETAQRLRASSIPNSELLDNLGLYLTRQNLSRINFMQMLYQKIVPVHGVIMEFGVRWGQNMALFSTLRGIHEPYNYNRKVIGFDTFSGFPSVSAQDGEHVGIGDYGVTTGWYDELNELLDFHNQNAPIPHKKKYELVKGDASETLPGYLKSNPETIVALAYFDFDIYQPTHDCLSAILPYLTKGSILAFDELNVPDFPGETIALKEILGLSKYAIRRDPSNPLTSYIVIE
ncbi:crotonobetainyl-CoA--carnitine CoA-transferase [Maridesulfovibrio salexigens]|uniref:Putative dTDP-6-deoxy-L-hexose 3-O-methyltransferase n=1 Tax=Maridesulfovibrio salexigens (strain ATCC 14822 / DSM 2638 / NCIMB 8403 / VKM B-1763) TaxID=526222 RepID=C6BTK0_MARSD|nr:crotonobetainyl-CoA--carnitine CoA-transferase [Maridesulfovibrio salexigens]ACS81681.1 putative dTDP-6-deoxy-L-hexose 3-O-methyltransferase [Maridesulfovibrio salexigens DSM 2638]